MSWKRWLPAYDVPKKIDKLVNAGVLRDKTWKGDIVPHFVAILSDGSELVLWVDHPTVGQRALPDGPRYGLENYVKGELPRTLFSSNDLDETIMALRGILEDRGGLRAL